MRALDLDNHVAMGEFEPEPIPERDPDREYDRLRQEQDDDLVAALIDIASIRLTDFFAQQAE